MHYVSWDRSNKDRLKLLAEAGPEVLGEFTEDTAVVGGERWSLTISPESGAFATRDGVEIVRTRDSLKRGKRIEVDVEGRQYALVNEWSKDWIIDDADANKVAQFTQDHSGVRRAILEFEGETTLPPTDVAALAWLSRVVLENRKMSASYTLLAILLISTVFALMVLFI